LGSFLMILSRRASSLEAQPLANGLVVPIHLTRESIAEFLGLTIETVSRQFTALRKQGLIGVPDKRTVVLKDLATLRVLAGEDVDDTFANAIA
ncbi:MAG: replication/maintenance protein RepL, partial [Pseudomonadota bacterium]